MLEYIHQVLGQMLRTAEIDMADFVTPDDVDVFLENVAWAIVSIYHTVLNPPPLPPRCNNIWMDYALRHTLHSQLEQNWRLQASPKQF